MFSGGMGFLLFSIFIGEVVIFEWVNLIICFLLLWFYFIFFGFIIVFLSFNYFLVRVLFEKVVIFIYVNLVVVLLLGWGLNGEEISF